MTDNRLTDAQLAELKSRHPCDQVAERLGAALRRKGRGLIGACPICSDDKQSKTATRFECDADGWRCAVCPDGGDVIKLVQKANGLDFRGAVEWLGGARQVNAAEAKKLEAIAKAKAEKRAKDSEFYRERERRETFGIYGDGHAAIAGTAAIEYLARRNLELPHGAKVRSLPGLAYFDRIGTPSRVEAIGRAPAMLAAITISGRFAGLHMTYLDPAQPNGKLAIKHPETGEDLPAKKVRGSKAGGAIELAPCADPRSLIIGEGIETVLSVWRAFMLEGRNLEGFAFWAAVDLGNLGGAALETVPHPSWKTEKGRARRVPGLVPDPDKPAIAIPDSVERIVILGDGDSDPFLTQCAVARAAARWARPGREIVAAWSPPATDFNDLAPAWSQILELVDAAAPPAQPANSAAGETNGAPRQRRGRSPSSAASTSAEDSDPNNPPDDSAFFDPPPAPDDERISAAATLAIEEKDRISDGLIMEAAALDHSDTDNAKRLELYYGCDLTVMAQSGIPGYGGQYLAWIGTHWDLDGGQSTATIIAQRVGDLIKAEADLMAATKKEQRVIDAGAAARVELQALETKAATGDDSDSSAKQRAELRDKMLAGLEAMAALGERKKQRRRHAVVTKNGGKIESMLKLLSHHLRRSPDDFNSDAMLVATRSHTLRFVRAEDGSDARLELTPHTRGDLITALVPIDYDRAASCPQWLKNLERFQPDEQRRRTIQQFSGLGLLGIPIQKVMYHYGTGGNFKSVFLEVLTRTLGDGIAVGLPAESISGREERKAGGPSPDLERVFGKRMLRVLELPDGQPLQAGTIKKLTGGEKWPIRTLYKGYYEFQPRAKTHMSGNSLPTFDGSDGGMRRRLLMVEWPVTIAEAEQRDFEVVVCELMAEAPGILNWLIAGAIDVLQNGFYIAPSVAELTKDQIEEMDPIGQFHRECVVDDPAPGAGVQARDMYAAYRTWSEANAKRTRSETKFGRDFRKLCKRDDSGRVHRYVGVRLENVPTARRGDGGDDDRRDNSPPGDDEIVMR